MYLCSTDRPTVRSAIQWPCRHGAQGSGGSAVAALRSLAVQHSQEGGVGQADVSHHPHPFLAYVCTRCSPRPNAL